MILSFSAQDLHRDTSHNAGVEESGCVRRAVEVQQLLAEAAPTLRQTPVAEPWSWWPAVQAAWQRGEHEQVSSTIYGIPEVISDQ